MFFCSAVFVLLVTASCPAAFGGTPRAWPAWEPVPTESSPTAVGWQSPAKLHRGVRSVPGNLSIDGTGIEFRSEDKESSQRWSYQEIQTLDLWTRGIELRIYEKRGRFRPGLRRIRLDLASELPPPVAAQVAGLVGRPVRNGLPEPQASAIATIPALHRTALGGSKSNGILRFRTEGLDYVTKAPGESRSWRWADVRTLSKLDPYQFVVFAYRETYSFDLKEPMSRDLFDHLTDEVYAHNPDFLSSMRKAKR
jgi:hypothetical protein